MRVRIRFNSRARTSPVGGLGRTLASAMGALLTPAAAVAAILGLWRLAADLNWAGDFAISTGFFSHWQVWLALAAALELAAWRLSRYGHSPLPQPDEPWRED
jgi:hypothetical protein